MPRAEARGSLLEPGASQEEYKLHFQRITPSPSIATNWAPAKTATSRFPLLICACCSKGRFGRHKHFRPASASKGKERYQHAVIKNCSLLSRLFIAVTIGGTLCSRIYYGFFKKHKNRKIIPLYNKKTSRPSREVSPNSFANL